MQRLRCTEAAQVAYASIKDSSSLWNSAPPQKQTALGTKSQPQAEFLCRAPQVPGATSGPPTKVTLVLGEVLAERELLWSS